MKTKYAIFKNELYENIGTTDNPQLISFSKLIAKPPQGIFGYSVDKTNLVNDVTKLQIVTWFLLKYSSTLALGVAILAIVIK